MTVQPPVDCIMHDDHRCHRHSCQHQKIASNYSTAWHMMGQSNLEWAMEEEEEEKKTGGQMAEEKKQ